MTNDKAFKALFKEASPIEIALLRERLVLIMEMTRAEVIKNPENWNNPIVHSSAYLRLADLVDKHIGFDK
jgi:hypothetical protein